jgi:hypothetical protein
MTGAPRDTVYLVSYPKSGNTWLRFIIGNYLTGGGVTFANYHAIVPDMHRNPEAIAAVPYRPVFVKSHFGYRKALKKLAVYQNVIYLYRDGRDVSVSYHVHLRARGLIPPGTEFKEFFWNHFLAGKVFPGGWGEHVASWLERAKGDDRIVFCSYEGLRRATLDEMERLLRSCGIRIDAPRLEGAVARSSLASMVRDEEENRSHSLEHQDAASPEFRLVRHGVVGEWRQQYDAEMIGAFDDRYGSLMRELGYE